MEEVSQLDYGMAIMQTIRIKSSLEFLKHQRAEIDIEIRHLEEEAKKGKEIMRLAEIERKEIMEELENMPL